MNRNALRASVSEFKNKFKSDDREMNMMQLNLFTYLLEGYYMNKCGQDSLFDSSFFEIDDIPFNIYNSALYCDKTDYSNLISPFLKILVSDIYESFKDLDAAELAAIAEDNHSSNHFRIYNQKKSKPIDKKFTKKWFRDSFLEYNNNHYSISPLKVKNKTSIVLNDYPYEKCEVYCDLMQSNDGENLIINFAKELLILGKRDEQIIDVARLNMLMYLLEGYYMNCEGNKSLFNHDFEISSHGLLMSPLIVLYDYILTLSENNDDEYTSYYEIDKHLPIYYVKKIYDLYGKLSLSELNELFAKYNSPYNIIANYESESHLNIPKKMTSDWISMNKSMLEADASKFNPSIIRNKNKNRKKILTSPTCIYYHKYVFRKNTTYAKVKEFINSDSLIVNATKYMSNRFHADKKDLELDQLNMIMYLSEGFYMGMEEKDKLFSYDFKVVNGIPNANIIKYIVMDSLENNRIEINNAYNVTLTDDKREYLDYMYATLNDISIKDLITLCKMKNSPVTIVDKYKQNEYSIVPKSLTAGWLNEEFLKDGKKKIDTNDLKIKIKNHTMKMTA